MRILLFNVFLVIVCCYAFLRGAAPERIVAVQLLMAAAATRTIVQHVLDPFLRVEAGLLAVDAGLFIALVAVALHADRYYPMTIAAFQAVTIGVHVAKLINPGIIPSVYAVSLGLWSYPIVGLLGWGTYRHRRRLRLYGADASWSRSSSRSRVREPTASAVP